MKKTVLSVLALLAVFLSPLTARGSETLSYADYLVMHTYANRPERTIVLPAASASDLGDSGAYIDPNGLHGVQNALVWGSGFDRLEYRFTVDETGLYQLRLTYLPLAGRQLDPEIAIWLDGDTPFDKASRILLSRTYAPDGEIVRDTRDNDVRPRLKEVETWQTVALCDDASHYQTPYLFYLSAGEHTLGIEMVAECLAIAEIAFVNPQAPSDYKTYIAIPRADEKPTESIVIQAERTQFVNSQTLYPLSERADLATQPSDPVKTRMNVIGGEHWKRQGQWLEWTFYVPASGYYHITLRALQEYARGMTSVRAFQIDGLTPFSEMERVSFPYRVNWFLQTLGGDESPYRVYLSAGTHTLRISVAGSQTSESLRRLMDVVSQMSDLYRQIIVITGTNADADRVTIDLNRDFQLEKKIPDFTKRLLDIAVTLRQEESRIAAFAGSGSEAALLLQMAIQMESFAKKPETVPARLEGLKGNLSSLSSWTLQMAEQPLLLDYIVFTPVGQPLPTGDVGFFERVAFRWNAFIGSFLEDYNAVGQVYESKQEQQPLTVWVCSNDLGASGIGSGRDQTQLLKELIDQMFVPETGIRVNLSLIDGSGTLMQATLGNKGPDVALMVYKELPVNLAMRGALVDLSQFDGFEDVAERFYPSALIPYLYQGGVYALPETQNFYMIFFRKDMFNELGLSVPNTWKEMKALIPVLSKMGMRVGVPEPTVTNNNTLGFQIHLFQRGLNYYTDDLQKTLFDHPKALDAFIEWTDLYTKYSLPVKYDFFSRFRTGEMPIALDHYTMANTLAAAAPELDGLWDIAPIPGIALEDGSIDRSCGAMGTGALVMATSEQREAAFRFISWWTSDETQTAFGLSLENLMGAAARWPTANQNAFLRMRWTDEQQKAILKQWQYVDDIPQLPGNYIINRSLSFAFRAVVYDDKVPRAVLAKYNKEINKEIERKWAEFMGTEAIAP